MAYDAKTERLIALKKLAGKAQTSNDKGLANEAFPSGITSTSETIFGDIITSTPSNASLYTITEKVEYIRFQVSFIAGSDTSSGRHGFELKLPSDYESNSTNPKSGTGVFVNNGVINASGGKLQLIPPSFSTTYEAKPYYGGTSAKDSGTQIPLLDSRDWYLDYYNGIFFQQDPPGTGDHAQNPDYIEAFLYIGNMLDTVISSGGSGGFFSSPSDGFLNTTGSVAFAGNLGSSFIVSSVGADSNFFVSGSVDSRETSTQGTSVFGGDVAISGTLAVNLSDEGVGSQFVVTTAGKVGIGTSTPSYKLSVGGNMDVGEYIYHKNDANTYIRFQEDQLHIKAGGDSMIKMKEASSNQVLILSGGSSNSIDPDSFADTNFFVSGAIGSKGSSTAGTSVFGGDLVVSGALKVLNPDFPKRYVYVLTASHEADVNLDVPSVNFSSNSYSYNKNEIFLNGQLMTSGSSLDYVLDGLDSGAIKFHFGLYEGDVISIKQS